MPGSLHKGKPAGIELMLSTAGEALPNMLHCPWPGTMTVLMAPGLWEQGSKADWH